MPMICTTRSTNFGRICLLHLHIHSPYISNVCRNDPSDAITSSYSKAFASSYAQNAVPKHQYFIALPSDCCECRLSDFWVCDENEFHFEHFSSAAHDDYWFCGLIVLYSDCIAIVFAFASFKSVRSSLNYSLFD